MDLSPTQCYRKVNHRHLATCTRPTIGAPASKPASNATRAERFPLKGATPRMVVQEQGAGESAVCPSNRPFRCRSPRPHVLSFCCSIPKPPYAPSLARRPITCTRFYTPSAALCPLSPSHSLPPHRASPNSLFIYLLPYSTKGSVA